MSLQLNSSLVRIFFSERKYTFANRAQLLRDLNLSETALKLPKQVHGDAIIEIHSTADQTTDREADALISNLPDVAIGILTADCLPVFIWDEERRACGIVHAGWRGVKQEIIPKTIAKMAASYGSRPDQLKIAIGPAIRACCYEVTPEFADYFPEFYRPVSAEKGRMDLAKAAVHQSRKAGVLAENITDTQICTSCSNDRFFSFRKEKTQERIVSMIRFAGM